MMDRRLPFLLIPALLLFATSCGIRFIPTALEDPMARYEGIPDFPKFEARTIYANTTGDEVWAPESCGSIDFDAERSYEGNAIHLTWNKALDCPWVGMGIGWNAWEPKDLSGIMDEAAIQFRFRSADGESRVPIMIFLLEDYAGVMSAAALRANYMESYPLNEDWRTVTVPLSDFPFEDDGINLTIVKQLVIELQGGGDVLMDDMMIVPVPENNNTAATDSRPSITSVGSLPTPLFEGSLPNPWGLEKNECRDFKLVNGELQLTWWDNCPWSPMGFSWNRWLGVDMTAMPENSMLVIDLSIESGAGPLKVGFQDYSRTRTLVDARDYPITDGSIRIPLSDFRFAARGVNNANIKDFIIDAQEKGSAVISGIRLEANNL